MIFMDTTGVRRIEGYFARIGEVLGNAKCRASFAVYALGLLGSAERKSVEPMAALVCHDPRKMDAAHQRLFHFISCSRWSDREVRRVAAQYALTAMTEREPIEAWILDDTGFLKQGSHSVGCSASTPARRERSLTADSASASASLRIPLLYDVTDRSIRR